MQVQLIVFIVTSVIAGLLTAVVFHKLKIDVFRSKPKEAVFWVVGYVAYIVIYIIGISLLIENGL